MAVSSLKYLLRAKSSISRHHRNPKHEESQSTHSGIIVMTAGARAGEYHRFDAGAVLTVAEPDNGYRTIAIEMK